MGTPHLCNQPSIKPWTPRLGTAFLACSTSRGCHTSSCPEDSTGRGRLQAGTWSLLAPPHPPLTFADLNLCPSAVVNVTVNGTHKFYQSWKRGCTSWNTLCYPAYCWYLINFDKSSLLAFKEFITYLSNSLDLNVI